MSPRELDIISALHKFRDASRRKQTTLEAETSLTTCYNEIIQAVDATTPTEPSGETP